MNALNIKKGSSSHSAYDLRDPNAEGIESHTLGLAEMSLAHERSDGVELV